MGFSSSQRNSPYKLSEKYLSQSSWLERIAENSGEDTLDTKDLDEIFLIDNDVSFEAILRQWVNIFLPGLERGGSDEYLASLPKFAGILLGSDVEQAISFIKKHPDEELSALRFMVLSLRRDLPESMQ